MAKWGEFLLFCDCLGSFRAYTRIFPRIVALIAGLERNLRSMIHVIATIEVQPGRRAAFLAEFHRIVPLVRAAAGQRADRHLS